MTNIIEGILEEQRRVREHLIPAYEKIGPNGVFGLMMLRRALDMGDRAIVSGDPIEAIRAYKELQSCE